jgi:acyl transferase domain-containing protein
MGRQLLAENSTFRAAVQAVERYFEKYEDFSLEEELNGAYGSGRYERTEIAQPALFAIQVGVTEMLRFLGIMPSAVAGHSVGEVAAAWASGALTLEQAVKVIYYRSHFQGLTKGQGQMTAVALSEAQMRILLEERKLTDTVAIAGINSARGVTLSGSAEALTQLENSLADRQIVFKRLDLDYAFHSAAMDPIQAGLEKALRAIAPQKTKINFVSTVTGDIAPGEQLDGNYWWNNIRQPVQFERAIGTIRQLVVRFTKVDTYQATPRSNLFQRNTTGAALISAMPLRMRCFRSSFDVTRMCRRKVRAIFEKAHSIKLSQEPCLGV